MGLADWLITPKNRKGEKKNIAMLWTQTPYQKFKTFNTPKIYFAWPLHKEYGVKSELIENNMKIHGNYGNHLRFFSKSYENFIFQKINARGFTLIFALWSFGSKL